MTTVIYWTLFHLSSVRCFIYQHLNKQSKTGTWLEGHFAPCIPYWQWEDECTHMFVRELSCSWLLCLWNIHVHDRGMALACGNVASYADNIPPSAPPPTHSLIWDACVCPTSCFARWNGSKSSFRVKWFSCVSLTFVRYMLSPTERLVFMSSTLCYAVALIPRLPLCLLTNHIDEKNNNSNKSSIVSIMSFCNSRVVIIHF